MHTFPRSSPKRSQNSARRPRRTKAQIAADLALSGHVAGAKPSVAAVKRSRLAAKKRAETAATRSNTKRQTSDSPAFDLMDYKTIVAYLAKPNVLNSLFGGGSQTKVTGLPMSPKTLLNTLAIKLNNNYNEQHISTNMHLTGRTLLLRLRRYKGKYQSAKSFSLKTGAGLEPKHHARGIHTMGALLESMCPCYLEMDALFRDKGNVNLFGILDTGMGYHNHSEESEGDITNGHNHCGLISGPFEEVEQRFPSPDPKDIADHEEIIMNRPTSPLPVTPLIQPCTPDPLHTHYRKFLDNDDNFASLPPTTKGRTNHSVVNDISHNVPSCTKQPAASVKTNKMKKTAAARKSTLTAEEHTLDSSSADDRSTTNTTSAAQAPAGRTARASLSSWTGPTALN